MAQNRLTVLNLNGGGIAAINRNLFNHWQQNGVDAELVLLAVEAAELSDIPAAKVAFGTRKQGYLLSLWADVWRYLKNNPQPSYFVWGKELLLVVQLCLWLQGRFGIKLGMGCNTHTTNHLRSKTAPVRLVLKLIYRWVLQRPVLVTSQSVAMTADLTTKFAVPANRISTIPPLLDPSYFAAPLPPVARQKPALLFVGRLAPEKNIPALLRIFKELVQTMPEATLTLVGPGDPAPFKALVADLELEKSVAFAGPSRDLVPYFTGAAGLVLTSHYEGFAMVLAESLACGTPVVAFDCESGPAEIIQSGENGYLIPLGDEVAFAAKLSELLSTTWDPAKMRNSVQRYHPAQVAEQYLAALKPLLG